MRYRLLETVRQYGHERLDELGETDLAQQRHAQWMLAFAERWWTAILGDLDLWSQIMARELDNLRAALGWTRATGKTEHFLRLAKATWVLWWVRGEFSEGRAWLDAALRRAADADDSLRAHLLEGAAGLAWAQDDLARAGEYAEEGLALLGPLEEPRGKLACLTVLGHVALSAGDLAAAERFHGSALEIAEGLGDDLKGGTHVALSSHNLASVSFWAGDLKRATERYESARSLYAAENDRYGVALSELFLGRVAVEDGRYDDAASHLRPALSVFREMRFLQYSTQCVEAIAAIVDARGEAREAVELLAGTDSIRDRIGDPPGGLPARRAETIERARAELGEPAFAAAWAEGRALSEDAVLERAKRAVAG
jgi:tetratricopeptide (TPR) repeat protein